MDKGRIESFSVSLLNAIVLTVSSKLDAYEMDMFYPELKNNLSAPSARQSSPPPDLSRHSVGFVPRPFRASLRSGYDAHVALPSLRSQDGSSQPFARFSSILFFAARLAGLLTALLLMISPVYAFDERQHLVPTVHEQVTKDALGGAICQANLKVIALGSNGEPSSSNIQADDLYRRFKDSNLLKTLNYVEREKRKVLNFCATADVDQKSRARALYHFGVILHTLQDFYSNSNYLELKLAEMQKERRAFTSENLYNIPLIDWSAFLSLLRNGERTSIVVEGFDKGDADDPEAKLTAGGITYFALAKELAVRETERQWKQLESLIKAKLKGNGTAVTVSLKSAGCPEQMVSDVLKDGDNLVPEI